MICLQRLVHVSPTGKSGSSALRGTGASTSISRNFRRSFIIDCRSKFSSCTTTAICRSARHKMHTSLASTRSEEHTSELQSRQYLVCRLLLEKKNKIHNQCEALFDPDRFCCLRNSNDNVEGTHQPDTENH